MTIDIKPQYVAANYPAWTTAASSLIHHAGFSDLSPNAVHRGDGSNGGDCDLVIYVGTISHGEPITDDDGNVAAPGDTLSIVIRSGETDMRIIRTSTMIYAADMERAIRNHTDDSLPS